MTQTASYTKIETIIVETATTITAQQVVTELSVDDLKREAKITERYMKLEKVIKNHNLTHYQPRYNGMNW